MDCRHYFVADRLEDLVDEVDSRSSSRAHEHENFRLVSQLHVAIQTPCSRWPPRRTVWTNRLVVQSQRASPFYHDLDSGLVGLVGCLLLVEQLLNPIPSSNHSSRKSSEAVEVIHILFRIWFLQFPLYSFRDTISWECIVKNDGVRSSLIEL